MNTLYIFANFTMPTICDLKLKCIEKDDFNHLVTLASFAPNFQVGGKSLMDQLFPAFLA